MDYHQEILRILIEADCEGLSVKKIVNHVYNACNSLFAPIAYDSVYKAVVQDLITHAKKPNSLIVRTAKRGTYRINTENPLSNQLLLQFKEHNEEERNMEEIKKEKPLNLFEDTNLY